MKYKVGDRVRIKSIDWYNENKDEYGDVKFLIKEMSEFCGEIMTIRCISGIYYIMEESAIAYGWTDEMIEGLVEDTITTNEQMNEQLFVPSNISLEKEMEWNLPNGYIFKDENGNVINATKIVLEKKKKEYPKTYEECCEIFQYNKNLKVYPPFNADIPNYDALHLFDLLEALRKLLICRNAYWKLYGEEIGLEKPWEPSGNEDCFVISHSFGEVFLFESAGDSETFEFPTREMRDAFYENFKEEIEQCKELL